MKNEKRFVENQLREIITFTIALEAELHSLLEEKPTCSLLKEIPIKFVEV